MAHDRSRHLSRGIACTQCGLAVERNGPTFIVIEDEQGFALAYVCNEACEAEWRQEHGTA